MRQVWLLSRCTLAASFYVPSQDSFCFVFIDITSANCKFGYNCCKECIKFNCNQFFNRKIDTLYYSSEISSPNLCVCGEDNYRLNTHQMSACTLTHHQMVISSASSFSAISWELFSAEWDTFLSNIFLLLQPCCQDLCIAFTYDSAALSISSSV